MLTFEANPYLGAANIVTKLQVRIPSTDSTPPRLIAKYWDNTSYRVGRG